MRHESSDNRRWSRGPSSGSRRRDGLTLVELLVAVSVTAIALGAAWPWLWDAAEAGRAIDARAQTATSAAFAMRALVTDIELATGLLASPSGMSPEHSLHLQQRRPGEPSEAILVGWDAARGVLWRKTSSTYLADHVESFSVTYFDRLGGRVIEAGAAPGDWPDSVARVRVAVTVVTGAGRSTAVRDIAIGPR
jgi:prepilin-type N-terminal cleavage/methylation domain-containing protein